MRSLFDVLNSPEGASFLTSEGVLTDQGQFVSGLQGPARPRLADLLGAGKGGLVYAAQQVSIDYRESVLAKLRALDGLPGDPAPSRVFIWVDTDRSGAHAGPNSIRVMWPLGGREHPVRISPGAFDAVEPRFVPIVPAQLTSAIDQLGAYVSQSWLRTSQAAKTRFERLRALFIEPGAQTLSEFNHRVACFLLEHHLGIRLPSLMLSDLVNRGLITDQVNVFINRLDEIRPAFNRAVTELVERDIDPQVKPIGDDYLPLHFSCDVDARRLRLRHVVDGRDHLAVAACPCGSSYRFDLGSQQLSIDALAKTNRWSPDVCLLVFLNDLVSGVIVGKSSALYGVVLNRVLGVMETDPVAMFVPEPLRRPMESRGADSLLYGYLTGGARR